MKKYLMVAVIILGLLYPLRADDVKIFNLKAIEVTIGAVWYDDKDIESPGVYIQTPIVQYNTLKINFGVVAPIGKYDNEDLKYYGDYYWQNRTRPELSLSCDFGDIVGLPEYIPLEAGAYVMVSPYGGYGIQIGLFRMVF